MSLCSWNYWVINPGQTATDVKMSPPDPVNALRQRAASLRRKPHDDGEQTLTNGEKPRAATNGGTSDMQNGGSANPHGIPQDNMV